MDTIWFDDVEVGYVEESETVSVDRDEMIAYATRNDPWPIHTDVKSSSETPFGDVIASFGYVVSLLFRCNHKLRFTQAQQPSFLGALEWRVQFRKAVFGHDRLLIDARSCRSALQARATAGSSQLNTSSSTRTENPSW